MDIKKDYFCIEQNSKVICKNQDIDLDFQETLPAYLDDIYRVVKCTAQSTVTSADISFNEIKVFIRVNIRLTYYNENSGLSYADFEEEVNKSITADNLSDCAFVCADVCDKYVSFRVINQRRIDFHVSSVIHIDVFDKTKYPCLSSAQDAKLKAQTVNTAEVIAADISKIEFDEEFDIPADSPPIKRIVSCSAFSNISEVKLIKDKALVKGSVNLSVLYTADTENDELLKCVHSFNISKIIQIPGIKEDDIVIASSKVGAVFLKAKNSSSDRLGIINAYGEVTVNSLVIRQSEKETITDAYVLNRNSKSDYVNADMLTGGKRVKLTKQITCEFDIPSDTVKIEELSFGIENPVYKDSKISADTKITAAAENTGKSLVSVSSQGKIQIDLDNYTAGIVSIGILSYDYTLGEGKITVRANVLIDAFLYNETTVKLVSDITPDDEEIPFASLNVYFGHNNEEVWDIAKKFSSDVELIKKENKISSDTLDGDCVLIIPKA